MPLKATWTRHFANIVMSNTVLLLELLGGDGAGAGAESGKLVKGNCTQGGPE